MSRARGRCEMCRKQFKLPPIQLDWRHRPRPRSVRSYVQSGPVWVCSEACAEAYKVASAVETTDANR